MFTLVFFYLRLKIFQGKYWFFRPFFISFLLSFYYSSHAFLNECFPEGRTWICMRVFRFICPHVWMIIVFTKNYRIYCVFKDWSRCVWSSHPSRHAFWQTPLDEIVLIRCIQGLIIYSSLTYLFSKDVFLIIQNLFWFLSQYFNL